MNTSTMSTKQGGCGCCGKGSSGSKGECGCKSKPAGVAATCESCADTAVYQRPSFFEGQLLTEDDLQSLVQYVVDKNRLHNRHLWGDGVVCGLDAAVDFCKPGFINVKPGYALDCCGNDLVLSCPVSLDIAAMVRDLRQRLGIDCGPECPPIESKKADPAVLASVAEMPTATEILRLGQQGDQPTPTSPVKKPLYRFSLYLRYCEIGAEPVSPYSTGASCADSTCQPTRTREGVRFEIACYEPECPPPDLFSKYCECLGFSDKQDRWMAQDDLVLLAHVAQKNLERLSKEELAYQRKDLESVLSGIDPFTGAVAAKNWKERRAEGVAAATALLSKYARFFTLDAKARKQELKLSEKLLDDTRKALAGVSVALERIETDGSVIEVAEMKALKEQTSLWARFDENKNKRPESEPARLMAVGVLPSDTLWSPVARLLDEQRTDLLRVVELTPAAQSVELAEKIRNSPLPEFLVASADVERPKLGSINSVQIMANAVDSHQTIRNRLVVECLCKNINPPCPPCDDPRVLLASFGWEDCKVVDLCILVRKFVLTPNNLRYWAPWIGGIGHVFEQLCCGTEGCDPTQETRATMSSNTMISQTMAAFYAGLALRNCQPQEKKPGSTRDRFLTQQNVFASLLTPESFNLRSNQFVAPWNRPEDAVKYIQTALDNPDVVALLKNRLKL